MKGKMKKMSKEKLPKINPSPKKNFGIKPEPTKKKPPKPPSQISQLE